MQPDFVPGLELSGLFYREAVQPPLEANFPGLQHGAALIGSGSEVLGFDTPMSADHGWGPRVMLFLTQEAYGRQAAAIRKLLSEQLPPSFRGYPTNFSAPDPANHGTQLLQAAAGGPVNHRVEIYTLRGFVLDWLGFDIAAEPTPADWLTFPQQRLLGLTAGAIYHDDLGLAALQSRIAWYPHDVWLYLLAAAWARLGQEDHLMGRAGVAGDEVGSALIGARLVRDIMRLGFLYERRYAPYAKWFGTAFARLACGPGLLPLLHEVLRAGTWQQRQEHLAQAYEQIAALHNQSGLTEPLPAQVTPFFGRPFKVIWGGRFAHALLARISDEAVRAIAVRRPIGSIDLISDNTDLLEEPSWRPALRHLYE